MSMSWIRTLAAAAGAGLAAAAGPAAASCLENVNLSGPPADVDYNPFQAAMEMSSPFTLVAERRRAGQNQPRVVSVDLQFLPEGSPYAGSGINTYDLASGGVSVLSPTGMPFGGGSWVTIDFNNNQPTSSMPIRLVVPARQDAVAGFHEGRFGLAWRCTLSNGQSEEGQSADFLRTTIDVANRVRAVAVGGGTAGTLMVNPATQEATGGLAIRSTGPFTIAASSPTGFEMRLNNAGGASVPDDQRARYRLKVAGTVLSQPGASLSCARTGLAGANLNVRTELRDDPKALRAGNYMDVVTVEVTPQAFASGPGSC